MLGAISPAGAMVYCSSAYPGRITDQKLTEVSGVMDVLEPGDAMATDKGFNIDALMLSIGCKVIHPPKRRRGKKPHTPEAAMDTAEQANLRIQIAWLTADPVWSILRRRAERIIRSEYDGTGVHELGRHDLKHRRPTLVMQADLIAAGNLLTLEQHQLLDLRNLVSLGPGIHGEFANCTS